jgi:hypothetical protein
MFDRKNPTTATNSTMNTVSSPLIDHSTSSSVCRRSCMTNALEPAKSTKLEVHQYCSIATAGIVFLQGLRGSR